MKTGIEIAACFHTKARRTSARVKGRERIRETTTMFRKGKEGNAAARHYPPTQQWFLCANLCAHFDAMLRRKEKGRRCESRARGGEIAKMRTDRARNNRNRRREVERAKKKGRGRRRGDDQEYRKEWREETPDSR